MDKFTRLVTTRNYQTLVIAILFFLMAIFIHSQRQKPEIKVSKQDSAYNVNSTFLRLVSAGNKRVFSNILWIQTLMESDQEKYKKKDFADWMYLRFLSISTLDPLFYENYLYGGMYLSVIKDDLEGAAKIFDLGLEKYPEDYRLIYYAGFNYFYELGDYKKGHELLKRIENHPKAPDVLKFIVTKLQFELTKDYDLTISLLKAKWDMAVDETIRKKIEADLYAVMAQRDLECLNAHQLGCNKTDLNGEAYVQNSKGKWVARKTFRPYKIFRRYSEKERKK